MLLSDFSLFSYIWKQSSSRVSWDILSYKLETLYTHLYIAWSICYISVFRQWSLCLHKRINHFLLVCLNSIKMVVPSLSYFMKELKERVSRPIWLRWIKRVIQREKKRHTVKNALEITMICLIFFVSQPVFGKTHDKKMADTMYSFSVLCTS